MKEYILQDNEDYRDFLYRVLDGQSIDVIQLLTILLEIVITEIQGLNFILTLTLRPNQVDIAITHNGGAIKESILNIVEDQVEDLHYRHLKNDCHTLKICKSLSCLCLLIGLMQ